MGSLFATRIEIVVDENHFEENLYCRSGLHGEQSYLRDPLHKQSFLFTLLGYDSNSTISITPAVDDRMFVCCCIMDPDYTEHFLYRSYQDPSLEKTELSEEEKNRIVDYLLHETAIVKNLEINGHRYILSHTSAITDGKDRYTRDYADLMDVQDIVWNTGEDSTNFIAFKDDCDMPTTLISGHMISRRFSGNDDVYIEKYENGYTWMDIDCGCAMGEHYGQLSCLKIDDKTGEIVDTFYVN